MSIKVGKAGDYWINAGPLPSSTIEASVLLDWNDGYVLEIWNKVVTTTIDDDSMSVFMDAKVRIIPPPPRLG